MEGAGVSFGVVDWPRLKTDFGFGVSSFDSVVISLGGVFVTALPSAEPKLLPNREDPPGVEGFSSSSLAEGSASKVVPNLKGWLKGLLVAGPVELGGGNAVSLEAVPN